MPGTIRTIGDSGQIALDEQYAGERALVDEVEPGVWVIKVGELIPENERWLHEPDVKASVDRGLRWAAENPPTETDLEELERRIDS